MRQLMTISARKPGKLKPMDGRPTQRGMALIEALVALVILALGMLGLAAVQARMLVETRTTHSRATAIGLIGELSEHVHLNAKGARPVGAPAVSPYADGTGEATPTFPDALQASANLDCPSQPMPGCSPADQAAYDVAMWRKKVAAALMNGRASIWQTGPRQLQVVVAWQANENTQAVLSDGAAPDSARQVAAPMQITAAAAANVCGASESTLCHIGFIDIPPDR